LRAQSTDNLVVAFPELDDILVHDK